MNSELYEQWLQAKRAGRKQFFVLIDPDKLPLERLEPLADLANRARVDAFLIGGSLMVNNVLDELILRLKALCPQPVVLFPGSSRQLSYKADALLFLSLISGRNPELLIGKHVETAPFLRHSPLQILPTGYMLIDGGVPTSVSYMSNTYPIPAAKEDIAVATALAGEMLGLKLVYMDAGSGARHPVSPSMIAAVSQALTVPLLVGGGISTPEQAGAAARAGADAVVVGTALEKSPELLLELAQALHEIQTG